MLHEIRNMLTEFQMLKVFNLYQKAVHLAEAIGHNRNAELICLNLVVMFGCLLFSTNSHYKKIFVGQTQRVANELNECLFHF